ncbi:MAG: HAMP domain-containing protein [Verrucomicrobia bacterium]|nr:HAMP domain-containing protein [Verrucomicrobiota bacterium]
MNRAPAPSSASPLTSWWVLDPRVSLRARAALLAAAAGAALTALAATLATGALERELIARTGALLEATAQQLGDRLDQTVAEHLRVLRTGASLRVVRAPAAPAEKRQALLDLLDPQPELAWLALADAEGRIRAATTVFAEGADVALQAWFRGAREQAFASDPRESPTLPPRANREESLDGPPRALELAVPVADADGNPAGVLAAGLRWDWTRDALRAALPEAVRRARIGATVYAEAGTVLLDAEASGWSQPPDLPALPDGRRWRGSFTETAADGASYLSAYARSRGFRDHRGLGWVTVARQPAAEALAPARALGRQVAVAGIVLTLLATGAAWLASGRISRRLRSVGAAADRIRGGDVLATLPGTGGEEEVDRMCQAVGRLVETLRPPPDLSPPPAPPPRPPRTGFHV